MIGYYLAWLCQFIDNVIKLIHKLIGSRQRVKLIRYQQIPRSNSFQTGRLRLLIGLEGTLVCTSPTPKPGWDKINIKYSSGTTQDFYVKHRPYLDQFLISVSKIYDVSIYTTQIQDFALPIIDRFCIQIKHNFYRQKYILFFTQSCLQSGNNFQKEINMTTSNPHNVIFVDFDEKQCEANFENAYRITQYQDQENDIELLKLKDFLIQADAQMKAQKELDLGITIQDILQEMIEQIEK